MIAVLKEYIKQPRTSIFLNSTRSSHVTLKEQMKHLLMFICKSYASSTIYLDEMWSSTSIMDKETTCLSSSGMASSKKKPRMEAMCKIDISRLT